jgi:hypothetical protein
MIAIMSAEEAMQHKIHVLETMTKGVPLEFLKGLKRFEEEICPVIVKSIKKGKKEGALWERYIKAIEGLLCRMEEEVQLKTKVEEVRNAIKTNSS